MKKTSFLLQMAAAMSLPLFFAANSAQAVTWNGGGSDNLWTNAANWGGTAPVAGDPLVFAGTTRATTGNNNFAAGTSFGGISFTNTTAGQAFTLNTGNQITLGGNISTTAAAASLTDTIGLAMVLSGNRTITTNTNHHLVTGLTSTISESVVGSTLTKSGGANLTLNGNNTFTGNIFINQGSVLANTLANSGSSSSIGAGNAIVFAGGGLTYTGGGATTNRTVTLTGSAGTLSTTGTGALVYTGVLSVTNTTATSLTLAGTSTSNNEFQGDITNGASSAVSLTKGGVSTWILSGINTYTGNTTISAGTLQIGNGGATGSISASSGISNNATLAFSRNNTVTQGTDFNSVISGTGNVVQNGSGNLILSGANTYAGVTALNSGMLSFNSGNATATGVQALGTNASVKLGAASTSSGILNYTGAAGTLAKNITVLGNGSDTIQNSGSGLLTLSGVITQSGVTLTLKGGSNGISVTGSIDGSGSGSDLVIDGGTTTLAGTNTYNGTTTINSGTLQIGNGTDAGSIGATSAITNNGSLVYHVGSGNRTQTAVIGGTGSLTQNSTAGTLTLTGNNTYTGTTDVNGGTLLVTGNQSAASGNVTVAAGATLGGNGTLGGATTIAGILSPGNNDIGTLNVASNVTWAGAAAAGTNTDWIFNLGASNAFDLLNISGNFLKDTSLGTNFRFDFGGSAHSGTFVLVDWSGSTGFSASDFSFTNLGGGLTGSFAINGSQLEFSTVPEPSTWVGMAALGVCAIRLIRRRNCQA